MKLFHRLNSEQPEMWPPVALQRSGIWTGASENGVEKSSVIPASSIRQHRNTQDIGCSFFLPRIEGCCSPVKNQ